MPMDETQRSTSHPPQPQKTKRLACPSSENLVLASHSAVSLVLHQRKLISFVPMSAPSMDSQPVSAPSHPGFSEMHCPAVGNSTPNSQNNTVACLHVKCPRNISHYGFTYRLDLPWGALVISIPCFPELLTFC